MPHDQVQPERHPTVRSGVADADGPGCDLLCGIYTVNHMMMRVLDRVVSPEGLTGSRWLLLDAVECSQEPPTITVLSDSLCISPQNVSRMVAALEQDGLVSRDTSGPGRTVRVGLTATGHARLVACRAAAQSGAERMLAGIDPQDTQRTRALLARIIENIGAIEREFGTAPASATEPDASGGADPARSCEQESDPC